MSTAIWDGYHRWYYDTGVWTRTTFMGVQCLKSVLDMWNYQEIIYDFKPSLIVEFGTYAGGSTLFFSSVLKAVSPRSRVLTVDAAPELAAAAVRADSHIECMGTTTTDPSVATRIRQLRDELPGCVFAILDSDHRASNVLQELRFLRGLLRSGDYVVVEDSNINGHPVLPGWGAGPLEALQEYEREHPDDYIHDIGRETKFGFTWAVNGFLIRR